ncbi:MAG: phosphate ABC transporter substrate-binding protein PstS [Alphaproteobacteria bacterium]|nr:phosphate ABC transporter substrate-binding protein PstS [Alphaproteobacteria bacterium]
MKFSLKTVLVAAAATALMTTSALAVNLTGAGSSAIFPVLQVWAQQYQQQTGTQINYQPIGSGGGIKQIESKTVAFGATDKPLMHDEIAKNNLMQFPQVIISIVPVVHLPGIKPGQMVLNGDVLSKIYMGQIKKWNDPALKALNPNVNLPNMAILTVHRSDGSGTTFNFTNYLGKVNAEWQSKIGSDTAVSWPGGVGGKGNAGVAAQVAQLVGSIGYVEYAYAKQSNLVWTDMINSAGKRVQPTLAAFQAAAANADYAKSQDFYLVLTNQPGDASWPITATTWVLLRTDTAKATNESAVKFFDWALKHGQAAAEKLDYVPLPDVVVKQIEAAWASQLKVTP